MSSGMSLNVKPNLDKPEKLSASLEANPLKKLQVPHSGTLLKARRAAPQVTK